MSANLHKEAAAIARLATSLLAALAFAACQSPPPREAAKPAPMPSKPGAYYKDDGPGDRSPADLAAIPDAVPRLEPLHRFANRPYTVFGVAYIPATNLRPYKERGVASWYGRMFHNQKTAIGDTYDMYAMTAAHPTLPLPSYARVTSLETGRSVVVRVNDRGPFHPGRVIDLSYAAAERIGIAQKGSGEVEVESIIPGGAPLPVRASLPPVAAVQAAAAGAPLPVAAEAGGYVVQLGAFANYANAQNFTASLANQIATLGVEARVRQSDGLFRVSIGPFATRDDAMRSAERVRDALGLDGLVRAQ